jgi:hypothetical protein
MYIVFMIQAIISTVIFFEMLTVCYKPVVYFFDRPLNWFFFTDCSLQICDYMPYNMRDRGTDYDV